MADVRLSSSSAPSSAVRVAATRGGASPRVPGQAVTIVYTTSRAEPRLDWLADGLEAQVQPDDVVELVVVDLLGRALPDLGWRPVAQVTASSVLPKPCVWQGAQRVLDRDWWAASNARNTGIALASHGYVAFLDDRCRLGPRWLAVVRRGAADRRSVLAGSYDKFDTHQTVVDHRRVARPRGLRGCSGGWLYGGSFAAPLEWLLEVNGFEEGCDGLAGEDTVLGHMLANRGRRIDFVPLMYARKERAPAAGGHGTAMLDKDGGRKSRVAARRFGGRKRTEFTPDLRELRRRLARGGGFPDVDRGVVHRDWYDGAPLAGLVP